MKKAEVFLCLALLLSNAISASAEQLFSSKGDPETPVIVFKTQESMLEGFQYLISGGSDSDAKFQTYIIGTLVSGTQCEVLETTPLGKKVRILSGPYKRKVGWVPAKMVR